MAVEMQRGIRPASIESTLQLIQDPDLDLNRYPGRAKRVERTQFLQVMGAFQRYDSCEPVREDQRTGSKRWDIRRQGGWPEGLKDGVYNYVVRGNGEVRIPLDPVSETGMHHHELASAEPVIAAGDLAVSQGKITEISNISGHYRPGQDSLKAAMIALVHWRVPIAEDAVLVTDPRS